MQLLKKITFVMTSSWRHEDSYDTQHGVVINLGKFDACTSSSFRGVKAHEQTDRIMLYSIDAESYFR